MNKKMMIALLSMFLVFGIVGFAFAQSTVDWERECLSGDVELNLLENGSVLVKCFLGVVVPTATETATATPEPSPTATETAIPSPTATLAPSGGIVVDHTSIALFGQIPAEYIQAAMNLPMMFSDRSVGVNMDEALNCLASESWQASPASCRRDYSDASKTTVKTFNATDFQNGNVPELILFPGGYNRNNWTYADCQGSYDYMVGYFINTLAPAYIPTKDVLSCQFSYLNVTDESQIMNFFLDTNKYDVYDLEAFMAQYPNKHFVMWTSSLARIIGTSVSTEFNAAMREYAIENEMILMDMADIISHDRGGNPCYRDGTNYPAICRDYTTEVNGGHLGSVSGGKIQMAKAFWVLMAQIAGWNP